MRQEEKQFYILNTRSHQMLLLLAREGTHHLPKKERLHTGFEGTTAHWSSINSDAD